MVMPTGYVCMDSSSTSGCTNNGGVPVACNDGAECNGGICCGQKDSTGLRYTHVRCQQTCAASIDVQFCDINAPVDECAASGKTCVSSTLLPGYDVCQG
jgi:hypothetical protein